MADLGLSTILGLVGTGVSAGGTIASGVAAQNARDYQAEQQELAATEEMAAATRQAEQKRKDTKRLQSRLQARSAASGFDALDETVLDLAGDIAQEGSYQSRTIRRGGQERAQGLRSQAAASRMTGNAEMMGSIASAGGTIMSGVGSMAEDYGVKRNRGTSGYNSRYG